MVVFSHFRSTTLWKAFVLNALTASLIIYIALTIKEYLDKIDDHGSSNWFSGILTIIVTFCTSIVSYLIMFILFGYGGGMLADT